MAWEQRGHQRFYYRTRKVKGRVIREYLGRGPQAIQAAAEDSKRQAVRQKVRREQKEWEALETQVAHLNTLSKFLSHSALVDSGYYQHHRASGGRGEKMEAMIQQYLQNPEAFQLVIKAAMAGDKSVLAEVKALLAAVPQWADELGNLMQQTEKTLLDAAVGHNLLKREATRRALNTHAQRLAEEPSYVEDLLIQQLRLDLLMLHCAQKRAQERGDLHSDKLLNSAHRRFLASLKCLEQLRKFAPSINIQVAENQINVS